MHKTYNADVHKRFKNMMMFKPDRDKIDLYVVHGSAFIIMMHHDGAIISDFTLLKLPLSKWALFIALFSKDQVLWTQ